MWDTIDPDGRRVVLSRRRWRHILERHEEFDVTPQVLLRAVATPDRRIPGRDVAEEWFYGSGAGPARWFRVVVHFKEDIGHIITAFPRRSFP